MQALGFEVLWKGKNFARLMGGLWVALRISLIAVGISLVAGVLMGALMTRKNPVVKALTRLYLETVRIMPQMVLLFLAFFGTTRWFGWNLSGETASIIVFALWGTAEMGDLVRGALESIPRHQYESAAALGLDGKQSFLYVILPQTLRRLLRVVEMLKVAQQIIEANRMKVPNAAFGVYLTVLVLYFLACWPISLLAKALEKRWS